MRTTNYIEGKGWTWRTIAVWRTWPLAVRRSSVLALNTGGTSGDDHTNHHLYQKSGENIVCELLLVLFKTNRDSSSTAQFMCRCKDLIKFMLIVVLRTRYQISGLYATTVSFL